MYLDIADIVTANRLILEIIHNTLSSQRCNYVSDDATHILVSLHWSFIHGQQLTILLKHIETVLEAPALPLHICLVQFLY